MFIHRDRVQTVDGETPPVIDTELILAKQRNGPTGSVKIAFLPSYTKFENAAD